MKTTRIFTLTLLLYFPLIFVCAQNNNLISNHDFEQKEFCPYQYTTRPDRLPFSSWFSPNNGTPDLFDHCSEVNGVPKNFAGVSYANSGDAYAGLYLGAKHKDYKEYLSQKFYQPLTPGVYTVRLNVKLASFSGYEVDSIHLAFGDQLPNWLTDTTIQQDSFSIVVNLPLSKVESVNWHMVTTQITIDDTVKFFTIGNMEMFEQLSIKKRNSKNWRNTMVDEFAFYYLDDITLIKNSQETFKYYKKHGNLFSFENVYFEFDSYTILDESNENLMDLAAFLNKDEDAKLLIYGYTDSLGTLNYNQMLSYNRAAAIKKELVALKVPTSQIRIVPIGEINGIEPQNRKVEFLLK